MAQNVDSTIGWHNYFEYFREYAHQLLVWGYQDSRARIGSQIEETEITGFIVAAMKARINSLETPELYRRFVVTENNPIESEGRTGKRRLMPDIIIESTQRIPHPLYVFEAKRLRKSTHPISKYIGEEGLLMFINGRYAADCPEVAMIGYVQSDTINHWVAELETQFNKDLVCRFHLIEKFSKMLVAPDLPETWSSNHTRASGSPITIFHLLLDCL